MRFCQKVDTFITISALVMVASRIQPSAEPQPPWPVPPNMLVPPMMTAAMMVSSVPEPAAGWALAKRAACNTPRESREHRGGDVDADLLAAHIDTRQVGRFGIAADGEHRTAILGAREHHMADDTDNQRIQNGISHRTKQLALPEHLNALLKPEIARFLVVIAMMPLMAYCTPSVAMNAGSAKRTIIRPLNTPINAPPRSASRIATGTGIPAFKAKAQITPPKLVAAPMDKSMPPPAIRKVIGTAMMNAKLAVRKISSILLAAKKPGFTNPTTTSNNAIGQNSAQLVSRQ